MVAAAAVHRARAAYAADLAAAFARDRRSGTAITSRTSRCATSPARRTIWPDPPRTSCARGCRWSGPQRDVLELLVDGRPAAEVLSGGEQKMIVLFLKFAKLELFRRRHEDAPLFLLDDVDAELDLEILQQLLSKSARFDAGLRDLREGGFSAGLAGRSAPPPNH